MVTLMWMPLADCIQCLLEILPFLSSVGSYQLDTACLLKKFDFDELKDKFKSFDEHGDEPLREEVAYGSTTTVK